MSNDKIKHGNDNQQSPSKSGIKSGETRKDQFQGGKQAGQPLRQGQDQKSSDKSDKR